MSKDEQKHVTTDEQKAKSESNSDSVDTAEERAEPVDVEALQQEIEDLKEQSKHHLDQWKRAAANLENYRKRVEKERGELLQLGQATLIAQLLPVLDDLERAFLTLPPSLRSFTWTEGMALIERKLDVILERHGLKEIEALGKPFAPMLHQSILQEETTAYPDGHVTAILQKGYMLHDKVLRPAIVKIARNKGSEEVSSEAEQTEAGAAEETEAKDNSPSNDQH